jgi:PPOX class probable F420-dependent enzyme
MLYHVRENLRLFREGPHMTMIPEEEQFLKEHRFCVLSTLRGDGSPQATPVYYLYQDGRLYISATRDRFKTLHIQRDPRVAVCVLHEEFPFNYVQVMGRAAVTEENLVETTRRIYMLFRTELPEDFPEHLARERRVLLVVTPERVTSRFRR